MAQWGDGLNNCKRLNMSIVDVCSENEFEVCFNERNFNPSKSLQFDIEFDTTIQFIESVLRKHLDDNAFDIHPAHNNKSRFIDIACTSEGYLNAAFLIDLQQSLATLPEEWMVCIWETCYIFITPKRIFGFDPTFADPLFANLTKK